MRHDAVKTVSQNSNNYLAPFPDPDKSQIASSRFGLEQKGAM